MEAVFQQIQKKYKTDLEIAQKYYSIIFYLNNIHVTKTELNLVAYVAIHGTISTPSVRESFQKEYDLPINSVYNIVAKLQRNKLLIKDKDNKIRVNPQILPDFSKEEVLLAIKIQKDV